MKINDNFTLRTVRKKILMVTKLAGILLIVSYILSVKLPVGAEAASAIWFVFVILLVLGCDLLMGRFITKPLIQLSRTAKRTADLDFSNSCNIATGDEFGELAASLNTMAANLQHALDGLEEAKARLEKEVEQEHLLLVERKELADSLSHEMKTPLGIIRAYAEGLQDETDEARKQKYTEVIIAETERMGRLITELLDLSALENGAAHLSPERFEFVEFLETVAGRLLIDAPDTDFELQYELPDVKIYVRTDKARMEQVLDNLIVNARKNVRPGGVLKVQLTETAGLLQFSVYNQGALIPEENLKKIWDKFYRGGNSQYRGSGLGLAVVSQILSMQNLDFGTENLSDGVRFYFFIPTA